ncbi:hypothetical protein LTR53_010583 [Teratosphaeriaceae sp. CCFEE 6253]|nr:hypothetical protein LTR53_010583 [Teratosphaeriaceae sp. CCFEE 6253]
MTDSDNPGAAVAATPELLESVLMLLDMRSVLLSQRVSKTFEATIAGSSKLQQKLFLKTVPAGTKYHCTEDDCKDFACMTNAAWVEYRFMRCFHIHPRAKELDRRRHVNPLLTRMDGKDPVTPQGPSSPQITLHVDRHAELELACPTAYRPEEGLAVGSWRKMLVAQPVQHVACQLRSNVFTRTLRAVSCKQTVEEVLESFWRTTPRLRKRHGK